MRRRLLAIVLAGLMLLIAAACGQRPGVSDDFAAGAALPPGAVGVNEEGQAVDEQGNVIGDGSLVGGTEGTAGSQGTEGTEGTTQPGEEGPGGDGPGPGNPNVDDSSQGVSKDVIKIGIHAPLTGAAPVPSDSVEKGKDLYFRWNCGEKNQSLPGGRCVEVVLKNDNYNPSQAVAVCKEMVQKDEVFLLSGAAGTDQIQACARYANSVGVPYLGAGVTEVGLTGLPYFFATSMTYPDQGPLLADYLVEEQGAKNEKNAMLWFDTPNFQDAHDAFVDAMSDRGISLAYDKKVSKGAGNQTARSEVQAMSLRQIDNVFILTSPVWFLQVIAEANRQQFSPLWTGVGITMTFDTVANVGCGSGPSLDGATFFSPFPAWSDTKRFDPEFDKAVRALHPEKNGGDDFMWLSWSGTKGLWEMFKRVGADITRNKFVDELNRTKNLRNGIGPPLTYSPSDHFGADQVHVSRATCSDRRWHTIQSFVNDW
jgi:branched-chain amino acid transport system substrate-binding protein